MFPRLSRQKLGDYVFALLVFSVALNVFLARNIFSLRADVTPLKSRQRLEPGRWYLTSLVFPWMAAHKA